MFAIKKWVINAEHNSVTFHFECSSFGRFCEEVTFPQATLIAGHQNDQVFCNLLDLMAGYLGVSYFKLAALKEIKLELPSSKAGQKSIEKLYTEGLAEFYVRNGLDYPPLIHFHHESTLKPSRAVPEENLQKVSASVATVAFGGGKDSHTSISLLDKLNVSQELVSVALSNSVKEALQRLSETEVTFVTRKIDPKLISLTKQGKGYNGHVPITAINSIILVAYSYLVGNNWVVFSNEHGASVPT
ncbi:MAG: hypothetical protein HKM24_00650, partial [Gammaproteobacteria bacterium]|nr:hypothetical protein [Gammaproteobacteria bacterium]